MNVRALIVALVAAALVPIALPRPLEAQIRPAPRRAPVPVRARGDTVGGRRDATRADTSAADSAKAARLRLSEPDSVMRALMSRPGYTITRYEAQKVTFDATDQQFRIMAEQSKRAIVQRDSAVVVTDSAIFYNEHNKVANAVGSDILLHDPTSGQADVNARGRLQYDLSQRSARITNPVFTANTGENWYIRAIQGKVILPDSTHHDPSFYGLGGRITSCSDSIPDYHFEVHEVKRSGGNTLVARPAVLYIKDIPVAWLPFLFQDTRPGRHSGILPPRFGLSDIVRSSPAYRRNVENLGYYWDFGDYMDASTWLDWRSAEGGNDVDPGWVRFNGEWRYNWLDRFLSGNIASSYQRLRDGRTNLAVTWGHQQSFTRDRRLSLSANYVTSTMIQRQTTINPYAALATIRSQVNYSDKIGPATLQFGGSRTQYPGREQVDQTFPTLTVNTGTLNLANWLNWTPSFSFTGTQSLHLDSPGPFAYRYFRNPAKADSVDSTLTKRNTYTTSTSFDTPIRIFGYDLRNSFRVNERVLDFPQTMQITDVRTGQSLGSRIFPKGYETDVDWSPQFTLPPLARNMFNITPSVSLSNATSGPFWVRTNLSNGQFVHQTLRPSFGLSASPTIFGLLPGFGPFTRFRHSIQPTIGYSYAPRADVSDAYLQALGRSRKGEFVGLQSNQLNVGLTQNIEAKVRAPSDTSPDQAQKIKLLTLTFSPLQYNIDQARAAHSAIRGLTTDNFSYSLRSDLLPSFNFQVDYSLFQGSTLSDTAKFSPYRTRITAGLSLSRDNNPFAVFTRLFGRAVPENRLPNPSTQGQPGNPPDDAYARQLASQPVAGTGANNSRFIVPTAQGWSASLSFTSARSRPVIGGNVVVLDPRQRCEDLGRTTGNPLIRDVCLQQVQSGINPTATPDQLGIVGATQYISPPTTNLAGQFAFGITPNWSASWNTSYDFVRHEFAEHMVTLQRDLHDWRAVFSFTRSPNGNFAFSFFVALKAEPDLKFDYNKATIRSGF